jgi:hypothetical protein
MYNRRKHENERKALLARLTALHDQEKALRIVMAKEERLTGNAIPSDEHRETLRVLTLDITSREAEMEQQKVAHTREEIGDGMKIKEWMDRHPGFTMTVMSQSATAHRRNRSTSSIGATHSRPSSPGATSSSHPTNGGPPSLIRPTSFASVGLSTSHSSATLVLTPSHDTVVAEANHNNGHDTTSGGGGSTSIRSQSRTRSRTRSRSQSRSRLHGSNGILGEEEQHALELARAARSRALRNERIHRIAMDKLQRDIDDHKQQEIDDAKAQDVWPFCCLAFQFVTDVDVYCRNLTRRIV